MGRPRKKWIDSMKVYLSKNGMEGQRPDCKCGGRIDGGGGPGGTPGNLDSCKGPRAVE